MATTALGFSDAILWLKRANALDNEGLADVFGVTESAVSRWLNDKARPPLARRRRWERDLQMPPGWLDAPTMPIPLLKRPEAPPGQPEAAPVAAQRAEALARLRAAVDELATLCEDDSGEGTGRPPREA